MSRPLTWGPAWQTSSSFLGHSASALPSRTCGCLPRGVDQFSRVAPLAPTHSILTLSTCRHHRIPQVEGLVPQSCALLQEQGTSRLWLVPLTSQLQSSFPGTCSMSVVCLLEQPPELRPYSHLVSYCTGCCRGWGPTAGWRKPTGWYGEGQHALSGCSLQDLLVCRHWQALSLGLWRLHSAGMTSDTTGHCWPLELQPPLSSQR